MPNPVLKICGLTSPALVDHAASLGVDLVGFVHFPPSPRHLEHDALAGLVAHARGRVPSVVLLVDPDDATFDAVVALQPDFIQLHGKEAPARVAELARRGVALMKALPVAEAADLDAIAAYAPFVDMVLLDAKPPRDATRPGGLGTAFDWSLLDQLDGTTRFLLSGGLDPDNVSAAIERVRPYGLDVSSGVESTKGVKDPTLMQDFVMRARNAAQIMGDAAP